MGKVHPGMVEHSMAYHTNPKMSACNHPIYKPFTIIGHPQSDSIELYFANTHFNRNVSYCITFIAVDR